MSASLIQTWGKRQGSVLWAHVAVLWSFLVCRLQLSWCWSLTCPRDFPVGACYGADLLDTGRSAASVEFPLLRLFPTPLGKHGGARGPSRSTRRRPSQF